MILFLGDVASCWCTTECVVLIGLCSITLLVEHLLLVLLFYPSLSTDNYIAHPQLNLVLLALMLSDFHLSLVPLYQDHHDPQNLRIYHICYLHLRLNPIHNPRLFTYMILFFSFLVLSPLKLRLNKNEFHPSPHKLSH